MRWNFPWNSWDLLRCSMSNWGLHNSWCRCQARAGDRVEMHMDMSQEVVYHLGRTPGLNCYRKNPSVWPHCWGKNRFRQECTFMRSSCWCLSHSCHHVSVWCLLCLSAWTCWNTWSWTCCEHVAVGCCPFCLSHFPTTLPPRVPLGGTFMTLKLCHVAWCLFIVKYDSACGGRQWECHLQRTGLRDRNQHLHGGHCWQWRCWSCWSRKKFSQMPSIMPDMLDTFRKRPTWLPKHEVIRLRRLHRLRRSA